MVHLRAVERNARTPASEAESFPFNVQSVRSLERLTLDTDVTLFVGENGSGKSTVLEAIAAAARLPAVGSSDLESDETLAQQRRLARTLRLIWSKRTHRGFFLRAEDFFGFSRRLAKLRAEMLERIAHVEGTYGDRSDLARGLARGPAQASLAEMQRLYGEDLDAQSHGESFLQLFQSRLAPNGLFLLDEPEAALSPQSQLGLLAMIKRSVAEGGQFILATHSPILLACPGARIYTFDENAISEARYDDLPHVTLTRAFLRDPEAFLRRL